MNLLPTDDKEHFGRNFEASVEKLKTDVDELL
jgi:hypothetical protein